MVIITVMVNMVSTMVMVNDMAMVTDMEKLAIREIECFKVLLEKVR